MQKNKYTIISYIVLIFLALGISQDVAASHIMGGNISYVCLGNGKYAVNLYLYRDCNGISFGSQESVTFTSSTCGTQNVNLVNVGGGIDRTPLCPGEQSACGTGTGLLGVEEWLYRGTVTLPVNCGSDWVITWSQCCRNGAITTLNNPASAGTFIDAKLNNTAAVSCNSSPAFNSNPTFYLCANQENRYSNSAIDQEGDSLVYSFINCRTAAATTVTYNAGLSGSNPLVASIQTVNAQTGQIIIKPTTAQVGVICLQVQEYRNNVKIGEIVRDLQFTVTNCQGNTLPILSGVNGTADSTGTTGSYSVFACVGDEVDFKIKGFDAQAVPSAQQQNLSISWNYGIQGSSFIVDYNLPYPVAEFKWTPTQADIGQNVFFVEAKDDACPFNGSNVYSYTVNVLPALNVHFAFPTDTINEGDTVMIETLVNTIQDLTYSWSPATGLSCTDCATPDANPTQTTTYTVEVTNNITGCAATAEFTIVVFAVSTNDIPQNLTNWNVFPNPIIANSTLQYELSKQSHVRVELYNVVGERIAILADERQTEGEYLQPIGQYLAGKAKGIYFITMQIDGQQVTKKLVVR